jgi:hypothetical protein
LTGIISAIVDKSTGGNGVLWTFYPTGDVSMVVVGCKGWGSNLLQNLGESGFVHFDKLLSQVSSDDP